MHYIWWSEQSSKGLLDCVNEYCICLEHTDKQLFLQNG